jgi:hypothetical protein
VFPSEKTQQAARPAPAATAAHPKCGSAGRRSATARWARRFTGSDSSRQNGGTNLRHELFAGRVRVHTGAGAARRGRGGERAGRSQSARNETIVMGRVRNCQRRTPDFGDALGGGWLNELAHVAHSSARARFRGAVEFRSRTAGPMEPRYRGSDGRSRQPPVSFAGLWTAESVLGSRNKSEAPRPRASASAKGRCRDVHEHPAYRAPKIPASSIGVVDEVRRLHVPASFQHGAFDNVGKWKFPTEPSRRSESES